MESLERRTGAERRRSCNAVRAASCFNRPPEGTRPLSARRHAGAKRRKQARPGSASEEEDGQVESRFPLHYCGSFRRAPEAFYRHYTPQNATKWCLSLRTFVGEAELFTALQQKYGPDEQHPSGTPGGGDSAAATHRVTAAAREAAEYYQDLASRATENDAGVPSTPGRFDGDGTAHPGHEEEKKWAQDDDFAGHDEESASYSPSKSSASVRSSVQMVQHVGSVFGAAGDVLLDVALSADEEEIEQGSTEEVEVEDEEAGGQDDIGTMPVP